MKKLLIIAMALAGVIGLYTMLYANGQGDGVVGSPHDFTDGLEGGTGGAAIDENWNARKEICRVCHVPHDHGQVAQRYTNGLLWNHGISSATYTMYNNAWSSTIDQTQSAQPDGTAKLCLGCHDGTVGIDTFDKYAGGAVFIGTYDAGYKVPGFVDGTNLDLRGTHPISISYPAAGVAGEFNAGTATWTSGDTIASTLDNGKVQCSTCHDVHDQETIAGTHLLRTAQTVATGGVASGLCLTCHIK
ncbi:MAG: hypothetical protein HY756_09830 [Nitrospirae bacterium]|nr:hypothetical protein [Nitrospirota bacterium]